MRVKDLLLCVMCAMMLTTPSLATVPPIAFDDDWRFTRNDVAGAEAATFADTSWQAITLPHDWSVSGPIARNNPMGSPGGFFPAGVGWYRKTFDAPADWAGKQVVVQFDGIYLEADIWLNGQKLGSNPWGYRPITLDLTPHLKVGGANTIAVRVDNSKQFNSRWYAGSGIYRHVRLLVREPIHLADNGVFVTTRSVTDGTATIDIALTSEKPAGPDDVLLDYATQIFQAGPDGQPKGGAVAEFAPITAGFPLVNGTRGALSNVKTTATLPNAKLWSTDTPNLYIAETTVSSGGRTLDTRRTTFGVRTISVSADKGFLLNGKAVELFGACVHDDNGPLGVAAFDRAIERRVKLLKAAGFNAVRCAHNPYPTAFYDACDRLGLLVIDEAFDTWSAPKNPHDYGTLFAKNWQTDLDAMILGHRNHPSIVVWSVGNEVWLWDKHREQSFIDGSKLIARAKELDPTRFVTTAVAGWNLGDPQWQQMEPLLKLFDVVGYNYALHRYESDHKRFPDRIIIGTESFPRDVFETWDLSDKHAHVLGDFVWTGIDYLGESGIGRYHQPDEKIYFHLDPKHFPYHGAYCGDIDLTGFRKPISYQRNIVWDRGEKLYTSVTELTPDGRKYRVAEWGIVPSRASWTWPGQEGRPLEVQVYSRHDSVRLYLNDKLIGEKPTTRNEKFKAVFEVPYAAGTLKTVGIKDGREVATNELKTAGPVAGLRLSVDRTELAADGQDLAFVTVESVDAAGNLQPNGDANVTFAVDGPATLAGVASGDLGNLQGFAGKDRKLFNGRAQAVVRTTNTAGPITVRATAESLTGGEATMTSR